MGRILGLAIAVLLGAAGCTVTSTGNLDNGGNPTGHSLALDEIVAEINASQPPADVEPKLYTELKAELIRVLEERVAREGKLTCGPPEGPDACPVVAVNAANELCWYYRNPGDYDQNGEVNIADITPLGSNFGANGPFSFESALSIIDGDSNGELNIADITPIGQNFGTSVSEYNVYGSDSLDDYPQATSSKGASAAALLGTLGIGDATGEADERKHFSYDLSGDAEAYAWVTPSDGEGEGTPSTVSSCRWIGPVEIIPGPQMGIRATMALIKGVPAVACIDPANSDLLYVQATGPGITSWGAPIVVDSGLSEDCYPDLTALADDTGIGIGYFKDDDPWMAISNNDGADWFSWMLVPGAASSSSLPPKVASDPPTTKRIEVLDLDGFTHGFYVADNKLYHVGCKGTGVIYEGSAMSNVTVEVDRANGRIFANFYDGQNVHLMIWDGEGWSFGQTIPTLFDAGNSGLGPELELLNDGSSIVTYHQGDDHTVGSALFPPDSTQWEPFATPFELPDPDGQRFQVQTVWRDFDATPGQTSPISGNDSCLFYFFSDDNAEVLVKVLDTCNGGFDGQYWVFAAGITDIEVSLTLTDTPSGGDGSIKMGLSPTAYDAIIDTTAFATCP